ncbi:MAG: DUF6544 family protein [Gemmatimonadota bacterium]
MARKKIIPITLLGGTALVVLALLLGSFRWQAATKELHAPIQEARLPLDPGSFAPREVDGLPEPVQRYFRAALEEGQPMVSAATMEHEGTFNMSENGEQWKTFSSVQRVVTHRPGFVWDARIRMMPGLDVHVHDAYVAGEGVLTTRLLGLFTVMNQPSSPELAEGELLRFFAEAAWYPTALLPSNGVVWEAMDEDRARATITDGPITTTLVFEFDAQGLISTVRSEGRYRQVDGIQGATPWQGRFWSYERRDRMLIPLEGEVAWVVEGEPRPYWRGRIQEIEYEFSPH